MNGVQQCPRAARGSRKMTGASPIFSSPKGEVESPAGDRQGVTGRAFSLPQRGNLLRRAAGGPAPYARGQGGDPHPLGAYAPSRFLLGGREEEAIARNADPAAPSLSAATR